VEWYFGHKFPHMDINCEDWRSRDRMWDQTRHALEFFHAYLPFNEMQPYNGLTSDTADYCLAKPGKIYVIYLPNGGSTELKVQAATYSVDWYNPRSGGPLLRGSVQQIIGPGSKSVGQAPDDQGKDWAVLVRKSPSPRRALRQ
jgi:hypothetical protein